MALDPRLILNGVQAGIQNAQPFSNLMAGAQQQQQFAGEEQRQNLLAQQAEQQAGLAPLQQQLLEQRVQAGQSQLDAASVQAEQQAFANSLSQLGSVAKTLKPFIESGDLIGAAGQIDTLEQLGLPQEILADIDSLIATGDLDAISSQIATVETLNRANMGEGEIIKSSQRLINKDGKQFSEVDVALPDGTLKTISTPVGGTVAKKTTGLTAEQQAKLDVQTTGKKVLATGEAEVATPLGKIKLDEALAKTDQDKQDIINAKNSRRKEADNAVSTVSELLTGDMFSSAYGKVIANTPDIAKPQEALDAQAKLDQVIGLLSLESRQKLKGQGTITDSEAKTLEKSATILANPLISDDVARKELRRVRDIFEDSSARNQLNKETRQQQNTQGADFDRGLLEFMSPDERALFDGA